jgi:DNA helicase-2/ATP-dependent DNA helicase PcrA
MPAQRKAMPTPNHLKRDTAVTPPPNPTTAQYKTGQKVRHAKFGEGTVIESKLMGSDEEVTVAFPGTGIKRLAASFAKLEKIKD